MDFKFIVVYTWGRIHIVTKQIKLSEKLANLLYKNGLADLWIKLLFTKAGLADLKSNPFSLSNIAKSNY